MMETLIEDIIRVDFWAVVKVFYLVGLGIYLFFALVIVRQVNLMIETLNGFLLETSMRFFAFLHLGLAIFVFILALVVL